MKREKLSPYPPILSTNSSRTKKTIGSATAIILNTRCLFFDIGAVGLGDFIVGFEEGATGLALFFFISVNIESNSIQFSISTNQQQTGSFAQIQL
jgi:hypothetical protein